MQKIILGWPRAVKQWSVVVLDVGLALVATWGAFTLRLDALHWPTGAQWWVYGLAPMLAVPIFVRFGLYRAIFRYTGQAALYATGRAVLFYGVALFGLLVWQQWPGVPRSVGVLQPLVFLFLVGSSRALARFWLANMSGSVAKSEGRLLIYGAGVAGVQTASAIGVSGQYVVLGFVDDDPAKVN
jgi:FlaA1/EpsC-like NDP-sugar epimerase